jgi:integrase
VLEYAVAMNLIETNPTARIRNARTATRKEQRPFASWEEVEAIAAELEPRFATIPVVLCGTGLRPRSCLRSSGATSTSRRACSASSASTRSGC